MVDKLESFGSPFLYPKSIFVCMQSKELLERIVFEYGKKSFTTKQLHSYTLKIWPGLSLEKLKNAVAVLNDAGFVEIETEELFDSPYDFSIKDYMHITQKGLHAVYLWYKRENLYINNLLSKDDYAYFAKVELMRS